jgi:hypothetical protein
MPNQRAKDQVMIAFALDEALANGLDAARGGLSRSQFIREAIGNLLRGMGYAVPEKATHAPDRTRPYGRNKDATAAAELNDRASSEQPSTVKALAKRAAADVKQHGVKYGRSRKAGSTSDKTS